MNAINRVIELLNNVSGSLYNAYLETRGWIYPFSSVAIFFYGLSSLFASVSWQVYYFGQWVGEVTGKVAKILTFENIASHFRSFFNSASTALEWVRGAFKNVISIVDTWWSEAKLTIWSRIDIAKEALQSRIDVVNNRVFSLREAWDSFKSKIPSINEVLLWFKDWRDKVIATTITWGAIPAITISALIATAFKEREGFWTGWQDMRDKVFELFKEPEKWLLDMIERTIAKFL